MNRAAAFMPGAMPAFAGDYTYLLVMWDPDGNTRDYTASIGTGDSATADVATEQAETIAINNDFALMKKTRC